jgi:hypothetical protein
MKRFDHPFFDALDWISKNDSWMAWGNVKHRTKFYQALKIATPIIYDKKCTDIAISEAGGEIHDKVKLHYDIEGIESKTREKASKIEEFSLPHATSLYLLTDCPTIIRMDKAGTPFVYKRLGYLLCEIGEGGERVLVFDIMAVRSKEAGDDRTFFVPDVYEIDLNKFETDPSQQNFASDIVAINRLTNMISVKRVGVEIADYGRAVKAKGIGSGFVTYKTERLFYVADKVEYEYIQREPGITWYDYNGHWRGHWRAFYKYHGKERMVDSRGRDMVDYGRVGKNRGGEYKVPGYTWVVEHTKGNPLYASIKIKHVVSK